MCFKPLPGETATQQNSIFLRFVRRKGSDPGAHGIKGHYLGAILHEVQHRADHVFEAIRPAEQTPQGQLECHDVLHEAHLGSCRHRFYTNSPCGWFCLKRSKHRRKGFGQVIFFQGVELVQEGIPLGRRRVLALLRAKPRTGARPAHRLNVSRHWVGGNSRVSCLGRSIQ